LRLGAPAGESGIPSGTASASQRMLRQLGPSTAIVYAFVTDGAYSALLVTSDGRLAFQFPITITELEGRVVSLRRVLQNPSADPIRPAQDLYRILIPEGLRKELDRRGIRHIMWSLDGGLRYVPMGALHDGEQYLASRYGHSVYGPASGERLTAAVPRK